MELGAFSVSLAVKDIEASREFYMKFGFRVIGGDAVENWLILQNGAATIRPLPGHVRQEHLSEHPPYRYLQRLPQRYLPPSCRHTKGTVHRSPQVIGGDVDVEGPW